MGSKGDHIDTVIVHRDFSDCLGGIDKKPGVTGSRDDSLCRLNILNGTDFGFHRGENKEKSAVIELFFQIVLGERTVFIGLHHTDIGPFLFEVSQSTVAGGMFEFTGKESVPITGIGFIETFDCKVVALGCRRGIDGFIDRRIEMQ